MAASINIKEPIPKKICGNCMKEKLQKNHHTNLYHSQASILTIYTAI